MIYIQLTILTIFIALWIYGGQKSGRTRDVFCVFILALYLAIKLKIWWLFLACGMTYNAIRIGYGNYSPLDDDKPILLASWTHDSSGEWVRLLWGLLVSVLGALPLVLGHYLGFWEYMAYVNLNMVVNYSVSKFKLGVYLTDTLVAGAVASIIFFV